jgi:hypothetical protein
MTPQEILLIIISLGLLCFALYMLIKAIVNDIELRKVIQLVIRYRFIWLWKHDGLGYPDIDISDIRSFEDVYDNLSAWHKKDFFKDFGTYLRVKYMVAKYWEDFLEWQQSGDFEEVLETLLKWREKI